MYSTMVTNRVKKKNDSGLDFQKEKKAFGKR